MAGGGNVIILGSNDRREPQGAHVTGNAVHVRIVGSPTLNVNVLSLPTPVEVTQLVHALLQANVTLQLQDADIQAGAGLAVTRPIRIPVSEYGTGNLPNFYFNIAGVAEIPATVIADPVSGVAGGVNLAMGGLAGGGGVKTGPDRDAIVNLFSSQVFNVTATADSALVDVGTARYLVIYIDLKRTNSPTDIRLIAQFSNDGGTTWYDYAVDQWVDLRYVPAQMPFLEVIPLNYVTGSDFRLRAVAVGTNGVDTFTLTADVEAIT